MCRNAQISWIEYTLAYIQLLYEKARGLFDNPAYQKKISPKLYVKRGSGVVEIVKE